ncbi:MAG TPA: hypothetical protein PL041_08040, partial [Melioribacteraceae bacterium]|nr:hypothetical protein [Melioribacteraceae bacterium]
AIINNNITKGKTISVEGNMLWWALLLTWATVSITAFSEPKTTLTLNNANNNMNNFLNIFLSR